MMSALEGVGGSWKRDVARIFNYKSVPIADKGEEVKKSQSFADVIYGRSLWIIAPTF